MPARYGPKLITNPLALLYPTAGFSNDFSSARSGALRRVQAPGQARKTVRNGETPGLPFPGVSVLHRAPYHQERNVCEANYTKR